MISGKFHSILTPGRLVRWVFQCRERRLCRWSVWHTSPTQCSLTRQEPCARDTLCFERVKSAMNRRMGTIIMLIGGAYSTVQWYDKVGRSCFTSPGCLPQSRTGSFHRPRCKTRHRRRCLGLAVVLHCRGLLPWPDQPLHQSTGRM